MFAGRTILAAAITATFLGGCSSAPISTPRYPAPPSAREQILAAVLQFFESEMPRPTKIDRVLVTDPLDQASRTAASRLRPIFTRADMSPSDPYITPPGALVLSSLNLDGDTATVEAGIGPVMKPRRGELPSDCGIGYTLEFKRNETGQWALVRRWSVVC